MYYVIRTVSETNAMQVMVPVKRAQSIGLRGVQKQAALRRMLAACRVPPKETEIERDFRTRQGKLRELLKSGCVRKVTSAVRGLYFLNSQRPLGMTDRQFLDSGKKLLAGELALAADLDMQEAMQEVEENLAQMIYSDEE